jgi:hypothetical protein
VSAANPLVRAKPGRPQPGEDILGDDTAHLGERWRCALSLTTSNRLALWLAVALFGVFVSGAQVIRAERQGRRKEAWISVAWFVV